MLHCWEYVVPAMSEKEAETTISVRRHSACALNVSFDIPAIDIAPLAIDSSGTRQEGELAVWSANR
jgi:hypothetical protein